MGKIKTEESDLELIVGAEEEIGVGKGGDGSRGVAGKKKTYPQKGSGGQETDMQAGIRLGKILDRVQSVEGVRAAEVFRDFLEITELTLLRLPDQLNAAIKTGKLEAVDPPEIADRWKAVVARYRKPSEVIGYFAEGFTYLLDRSVTENGEITYADVIGCAYMQFLCLRDQSYKGQFFTPFPVAKLMAEISCQGIEKLVMERLKEAVEKDPLAQAMGLALSVCSEKEGMTDWAWKYLGPILRNTYEPVSILDPCVGSGVMLLAAASSIPRHFTDLGLVQYYGVDIDPICVQMCRINTMLYGLNGWSYRLEKPHEAALQIPASNGVWEAEKAPTAVIDALPEPAKTLYREVRLNPTPEMKVRARKKIIEGQFSLFEMPSVKEEIEATPELEKEM